MAPSRNLIIPFATFLLFSSIGFYVLSNGHLHEDAYILYIYSENFARGNGIAYFEGSGPIEGATDFLWMIILGLSVKTGIDVAIASIIFNGLGLAVVTYVGLQMVTAKISIIAHVIFGIVLSLIVVLSQIAQASYAGFGAGFYAGVVAILFRLIYENTERSIHTIPIIGLILGLIRPDGVIMGVAAALVGLYLVRNLKQKRRYYLACILAVVLGVSYFLWRFNYFGYFLPLPLFVKSTEVVTLPGLSQNIWWGMSNAALVLMSLFAFAFSNSRKNIFLACLPVGLLVIILTIATQSQNIAFRFQAPGTTVIILLSCVWFNYMFQHLRPKSLVFSVAIALSTLLTLYTFYKKTNESLTVLEELTSNDYSNYLAFQLKPYFTSETNVALTEAGRFAYWLPGKKYDLVGLNTPYIAVNKLAPDYLQELNPDLIFFHVALLRNDFQGLCEYDFCVMDKQTLLELVQPAFDWRSIAYGVDRAPLVIFEFLESTQKEYTIFLAKYVNQYVHVYLVNNSGEIDPTDFMRELTDSHLMSNYRSYWDMKFRI